MLNPATSSKLRRTKDSMGRHIVGDPLASPVAELYVVDLLVTTTTLAGIALAAALIRDAMMLQTDYGRPTSSTTHLAPLQGTTRVGLPPTRGRHRRHRAVIGIPRSRYEGATDLLEFTSGPAASTADQEGQRSRRERHRPVRAVGPWRLHYDGITADPGDTLPVPASVAERWIEQQMAVSADAD